MPRYVNRKTCIRDHLAVGISFLSSSTYLLVSFLVLFSFRRRVLCGYQIAWALLGNQCLPLRQSPETKRTQWALTREEMKNCIWIKPELVAQIEFGEWTPDGHLRHSKFVALRDDKETRDVLREG
jgi:ATP dependent DNA ligase C terminal region